MGQQQLLLIILGVIIVGIAIAVGLSLFSAQSIESNRDAMINDIVNLNAHAYQYYIRPSSMSGSGGSFVGYVIPLKMSSNDNATYVASGQTATTITFTGTSVAGNGTVANTFSATTGKVTGPYIYTGNFSNN
jgi:ABC-type lipoprotein release transport system permease subunit